MTNLFEASQAPTSSTYDASSIEVLEGLEPVRRRPGMYIGGTDERAYHHLAAEVLDNAMDEAVAGHATRIEISLDVGNRLSVADNGRGIPVDPHPKFPDKSALEVIMSTLHSGGKFDGKAYATSGGLHGVGVSVVNALSSDTMVEVALNKQLYRQSFSRGATLGPLEKLGPVQNRRAVIHDEFVGAKRVAQSFSGRARRGLAHPQPGLVGALRQRASLEPDERLARADHKVTPIGLAVAADGKGCGDGVAVGVQKGPRDHAGAGDRHHRAALQIRAAAGLLPRGLQDLAQRGGRGRRGLGRGQ
jgi:hypothetical protein